MRIAIYHELPSGGAKRALYEIARRLARSHEIDVFALSGADLDFCDLRPIARHHTVVPFTPRPLFNRPLGRLNQMQRWRDLSALDSLSRQTAGNLDRGRYDVIYVHPSLHTQAPNVLGHLTTPSIYQANEALRLVYEPDIPRPYHNRGWRAQLDRLDVVKQLYLRRLKAADWRNARSATFVLAISQFTATNLERIYGCAPQVIYLGVDAEAFFPARSPARQDYVLSVGALRPNKGYDFLIAALAQLPPRARPTLKIIGNADDPLERHYLLSLAQQMQVKLIIETRVDHSRLVRSYQEAALVVYAPVSEPLGFVPLEAAACGTPTVAVADGGTRETIIHNQTGLLAPRSPADFAAAVQSLLEDNARVAYLGQQGRDWVVANWTWDQTMTGVESALSRARVRQPGAVNTAKAA